MVFVLFLTTLVYSAILSISEMPDIHRPLDTCPKHPGAAQCRCRGNLPPPNR